MANGLFGGGDGTQENPYLVEDGADLDAVRENKTAYYLQIKDISLAEFSNWSSIEVEPPDSEWDTDPFSGVYDGGLFEITGLKSLKGNSLFGDVYKKGTITPVLKNIIIENALVINEEENGNASIIAGNVGDSKIINCHVSGDVRGYFASGLLVNMNNTVIEECSISSVSIYGAFAGGIISFGNYTGTINDCFIKCDIYPNDDFPNVIGQSFGEIAPGTSYDAVITNCYFNVKIHVGYIKPPLPSKENHANISNNYYLTALVEETANCYFDVEAGGSQSPWYQWGKYQEGQFLRGNDGNMYKCINFQDYLDKTWDDSWTDGPPEWWPGPFMAAEPGVGSRWRDFWEKVDSETMPGARTTEQLKDINTYVGWDFENVWKMADGQVLLKSMPDPEPTEPTMPTLQSEFFTKIGGKWFRLDNQNS